MLVLWRQFEFWSRKNSGDQRQRIDVCETKTGHLTSEKEATLQTWLKRREYKRNNWKIHLGRSTEVAAGILQTSDE
jgi:uncharacterized protein YggL (DUF469 family)